MREFLEKYGLRLCGYRPAERFLSPFARRCVCRAGWKEELLWNREILPVETPETGALGSAILGFAAVTGEKDRCKVAEKFVRIGEAVQPNPAHVAIYKEKYEKYKRLRGILLDETRNAR